MTNPTPYSYAFRYRRAEAIRQAKQRDPSLTTLALARRFGIGACQIGRILRGEQLRSPDKPLNFSVADADAQDFMLDGTAHRGFDGAEQKHG